MSTDSAAADAKRAAIMAKIAAKRAEQTATEQGSVDAQTTSAAADAKRAAILAKIAATKKAQEQAASSKTGSAEEELEPVLAEMDVAADETDEAAAKAAVEAKRAAIMASIAAAKAEKAAKEAGERKAQFEDFFADTSAESKEARARKTYEEAKKAQQGQAKVKDTSMQGNYGQTKFIKP